eukprot:7077702-Pyramimonas_sp.AAC.1
MYRYGRPAPTRFRSSGAPVRPDARAALLRVPARPIRSGSGSAPARPDPTDSPVRSDVPMRC